MRFNAERLNQYWTDIYFRLHYPHNEKVTHQTIRILQLVEKKDHIGIKEVASFLGVSHNTASENVKRILNKKYVEKKRDPQDERKVILELTPTGKEVLHRNTSLDEDRLNAILETLTAEEMDKIEAAFTLLVEKSHYVCND